MKLKIRKRLSAILSIIMFVSVFANSGMVVFAEEAEGINIGQENYENNEYHAINGTAYGTIAVPEGYIFLVEDGVEVTADEIVLKGGAQLAIFEEGRFSCENIVASDGATMFLTSKDNIPSGVTDVYDGEYNITDDAEWRDFTFIYAAGEGKWYADN